MAPHTPLPFSQPIPTAPRSWVSGLWRARDNRDQSLSVEPSTPRVGVGKTLVGAVSLAPLRIARTVESIGGRLWKWVSRGSETGERQSQWHWTQQGRGDLVDAIEKIHNASPAVEAQALSIDATGKHIHLYNLFVFEGTEVTAAIHQWAQALRALGIKTVEVARVGIRGATGTISESAQARTALESIFPRPATAGSSVGAGATATVRAGETIEAPAVKAPEEPGGGRQSQWYWTLKGRGDLIDTIENIHDVSPLVEAQGLSIDSTGMHVHLHRLFISAGNDAIATIQHWARTVRAMDVLTVEVVQVSIRGPIEVIDESPEARAALEAIFRR